MSANHKQLSKLLSFILRHNPGHIGLSLDNNGWANVQDLLRLLNDHGYTISIELLEEIVATNNKKRFSFDEKRKMIRANQGHSFAVDLELHPVIPPPILYHGTAEKNLSNIIATGLHKQSRQHVHLSANLESAKVVGGRHGKPVVLAVNAQQMHEDGFSFFLSVNDVWLTDAVPPQYINHPLNNSLLAS